MFCTKCGFNAGNSKFCPKCGAPLAQNQSASQEQTVTNATANTSNNANSNVTEAPSMENTSNVEANNLNDSLNQNANTQNFNNGFTQPQAFGQQPNGGFDQAQYGTVAQAPKAKKKWPKVVAIVVAIVAVLAVVGYFAYPFIYSLVSPKAKAEAALKNLGKNVDSYVSDVLDSDVLTSTSAQAASESTLTIDTLEIDDVDYLSYLNAKTLKWDVQTDAENTEMAGTLSICDDNGKAVVSIEFYSDGDYFYFSCPELFDESFKIDAESVFSSYSSYSTMLGSLSSSGSLDLDSVSQYSTEIKALVSDVIKGYNVFVENLEYTKKGNETFKSENGDIKVTNYEVTVTKDALIKGFNATVDALYSDKEISSYMSLLTSFSGLSKDSIKSSFASELDGYTPVTFGMYVNSKKEIVRLSITDADKTGEFFVEFIGKKDTLDYVHAGFNYDDSVIDCVVKQDGDSTEIKLALSGEGIDATLESKYTKESDKKVVLDNFSIVGTAEGSDFNISISGEGEVKDYSGLDFSKSDFSGATNVEYLTESEQTTLALEVLENIDVVKKVLSEDLVDEFFDSLGVSSTTTSETSYAGTWTASDYDISLTINADGTGVLTSGGSSIDVVVTISDGTIVVANATDATDYLSYAVSFTGNTMTWTDSTYSSIVFTKGV